MTAVGLYHHHHHHHHHHLNAFEGTSKYLCLVVNGILTLMYIIVNIFIRTFISPNFGRLHFSWRRDSSVGIATLYRLDGPGTESQWEARFSAPVQTGCEAHPASCTMGTGSFPGVSCGRGVMLTPHPLLVPSSKIE